VGIISAEPRTLGAFHAWRKLHDRRRPTGNWRVCSENLDRHEYAERDECRARGSFDRAEARPEPAEKRRHPDAAADGRYGHFLAGHPDQQWKALRGERGEGFGRCDRVRPGRSGEWIRSSKNLQRSRTAPCSRRYW